MKTYGDKCPSEPCYACRPTERTNTAGIPNWEWCRTMGVCAATIDWEEIYLDRLTEEAKGWQESKDG